MPAVDPQTVSLLGVVANLLTQLVKGLIPDPYKVYIPSVLAVVLMAIGAGLAAYGGRDIVAGLFEGLFGAAAAVGLYEVTSQLPGLQNVFHSAGWIGRKAP